MFGRILYATVVSTLMTPLLALFQTLCSAYRLLRVQKSQSRRDHPRALQIKPRESEYDGEVEDDIHELKSPLFSVSLILPAPRTEKG